MSCSLVVLTFTGAACAARCFFTQFGLSDAARRWRAVSGRGLKMRGDRRALMQIASRIDTLAPQMRRVS